MHAGYKITLILITDLSVGICNKTQLLKLQPRSRMKQWMKIKLYSGVIKSVKDAAQE